MSKLVKKSIRCLTNIEGIPTWAEYQGPMTKVIGIMELWADTGQWWKGESEKMFYRIQLEQGQIMEIYKDLTTGEWWLYKIYD